MSEINLTIKLDTTGNVTVARGGRVLEWPVSEAPPSCDEIMKGRWYNFPGSTAIEGLLSLDDDLHIQFRSGSLGKYLNVHPTLVEAFIRCPGSKGWHWDKIQGAYKVRGEPRA
jgi:hypothetical protein